MSKSYEQYINELNAAYSSFYSNGTCPHFAECSKGMEQPKIICDHAARVGKNYGKDGYPKVVVVGQEGISEHKELTRPSSLDEDKNSHYLKTLYTLALVMKGEEPESYAKKDLEEYGSLLTYFCLTNYYKCAFSDDPNKVSSLLHSDPMKKHCPEILLKELEILEGDLIIIQGKFTDEKYFENKLDKRYPAENNKGKPVWKNKSGSISLYKHVMRDTPFYVLYSYHPSGQGGWWSKTLDDLKTAIKKFREEMNLR